MPPIPPALPVVLCLRCAKFAIDFNDADDSARNLGCLIEDPDDSNRNMGALCRQCVEDAKRIGKLSVADWRRN